MAAPARERIAADVRVVLAEDTVKTRFVATSQLISPGTSTEFAASIEEQRKKLAAIAQKLGVKVAQ
jgi:tripartite-type tricarboxylate transporter receptor subunit TctC